MTQPLALAYRPRTFGDLAGQAHVATVLSAAVTQQRSGAGAPQTWLFTGPPGTGKTSTARMLAAALNSETDYAWDNAAIVEVDAATSNGVADVRELVQSAAYVARAHHRTYVLDECHALSEDAWKALLKALEEPPPDTTWVLVTTEAHQVPDAVLSRAIQLVFRAIEPAATVERLVHICQSEQLGAEMGALELLAQRAAGGMRDAIMGLDQLRLAGHVTVENYEHVFGIGHAAPAYLDAIAVGDLPGAMAVARAYAAGTGEPSLLVDEALELLSERLAQTADPRPTVAACRVLWEARHRLRANPLSARAAMGAVTAELAIALGSPLGAHNQGASEVATGTDLAAALGQGPK